MSLLLGGHSQFLITVIQAIIMVDKTGTISMTFLFLLAIAIMSQFTSNVWSGCQHVAMSLAKALDEDAGQPKCMPNCTLVVALCTCT